MAQKPAPETVSLGDVRARIDAIDDQILRLVAERAGLASAVAEAKRAAGETAFGLRPAREAQVLRRLIADPQAGVSAEVVIALWRQIMADSLSRQGAFHLSLWGGRALTRTLELTRIRFGAAVTIRGASRPEDAITAARTQGGVGVLALASDAPWWGRLLSEPGLNVFAALPCLRRWGPTTALAVAEIDVEPSGADETFWVTDAPQHPAAIIQYLGEIGFAAELIAEVQGMKLFTLAGFVQRDDARLKQAPGAMQGVIGAASMPFDV
jgi:chorismate mutase